MRDRDETAKNGCRLSVQSGEIILSSRCCKACVPPASCNRQAVTRCKTERKQPKVYISLSANGNKKTDLSTRERSVIRSY